MKGMSHLTEEQVETILCDIAHGVGVILQANPNGDGAAWYMRGAATAVAENLSRLGYVARSEEF